MWDHPAKLTIANQEVWRKSAMNLAELHELHIDGIDTKKYTMHYEGGSGFWNTREIKHIFDFVETIYEDASENKLKFLELMGWTLEARLD